MDPIAVFYYAMICAALSWAAPSLSRSVHRLALGAVVGVAAAACLPLVRGFLGLA